MGLDMLALSEETSLLEQLLIGQGVQLLFNHNHKLLRLFLTYLAKHPSMILSPSA
jgi:hypothetical protein